MAKAPAISMSEKWQGSALIDGKTPINFFVGFLSGMSGMSNVWATITVIGFEAFLVALDEGFGSAVYEKRSAQGYGNRAVDTLMGIAGVQYGAWLKKRQEGKQLVAAVQNMGVSGVPRYW